MLAFLFYILYNEKCDLFHFFACKGNVCMVELRLCTEQRPACRNAPVNGFYKLSTTSTQYA